MKALDRWTSTVIIVIAVLVFFGLGYGLQWFDDWFIPIIIAVMIIFVVGGSLVIKRSK